MGLINWIFDFYQHSKIDEAREDARQARASVASLHSAGGVDAARLERALGELALATKMLQRLMVEKGVCSQDELLDTMRTIDAEDGVQDGRTPLL
jgi:hypothetical protein